MTQSVSWRSNSSLMPVSWCSGLLLDKKNHSHRKGDWLWSSLKVPAFPTSCDGSASPKHPNTGGSHEMNRPEAVIVVPVSVKIAQAQYICVVVIDGQKYSKLVSDFHANLSQDLSGWITQEHSRPLGKAFWCLWHNKNVLSHWKYNCIPFAMFVSVHVSTEEWSNLVENILKGFST